MGLPFGNPFRKLRRHRRGAARFPAAPLPALGLVLLS